MGLDDNATGSAFQDYGVIEVQSGIYSVVDPSGRPMHNATFDGQLGCQNAWAYARAMSIGAIEHAARRSHADKTDA